MSKSSRTEGRHGLVSGGDPPRCPECGDWLGFGTDRQGRAVQSCDCGFKGYVQLRSGSIPTQGPAMPPVIVPVPVKVVTKAAPWPRPNTRGRPRKK